MSIRYDRELDILYIRFSNKNVVESDSEKPGIILDFDVKGQIISIEILNASQKMPQPTKFEFEVA